MKSSPLAIAPLRPARAFTLVELLISIVIIAVLIALAVPALEKVKEHAKSARCIGNLRAIGSLLAVAIADNGYYPGLFVKVAPVTNNAELRWFQLFQGYATSSKPPTNLNIPDWLHCPSRRKYDGVGNLGYGYNFEGFGHMPDSGSGAWQTKGNEYMAKYWQVRPAQVTDAGSRLVIGDSMDDDVGEIWRVIYLYRGTRNKYQAQRHSGGGNYLYADGHVAWLHRNKLWEQAEKKNPDPFFPF